MANNLKKLNILILALFLFLAIGIVNFAKPINGFIIWLFLTAIGFILHFFFKIIISTNAVFLKRVLSVYLPIFIIYYLYLLSQNLFGLDLLAYGASLFIIIEVCLRLFGI